MSKLRISVITLVALPLLPAHTDGGQDKPFWYRRVDRGFHLAVRRSARK